MKQIYLLLIKKTNLTQNYIQFFTEIFFPHI